MQRGWALDAAPAAPAAWLWLAMASRLARQQGHAPSSSSPAAAPSAASLQAWMSARRLPMAAQRLMASSTAALESRPLGSTRQRFMMPRYSPARALRLHRGQEQGQGKF
jgi:hypothetical protein